MQRRYPDDITSTRQHNAAELLRASLDDPTATSHQRIAAHADYRQAAYRDTGTEGMTGPGAVYHFDDAARLVNQAARTLAGDTLELPPHRSRLALGLLETATGYRYLRAAEGLYELMHEDGHNEGARLQLRHAKNFIAVLANRIQGARDAQHVPAAQRMLAAVAIEELALELLAVCAILKDTRERGRSPLIGENAHAALERIRELQNPAHNARARRKH